METDLAAAVRAIHALLEIFLAARQGWGFWDCLLLGHIRQHLGRLRRLLLEGYFLLGHLSIQTKN